MIRPQKGWIQWMSILVGGFDFLCFQVALILGYVLWAVFPWHGNYQSFQDFMVAFWILPCIGIFVFRWIGLYKQEMGVIGVQEQTLIFKGIWIIYLVGFSLSFFYRGNEFSRLAVFYSVFIAIILISVERYFMRLIYVWMHKHGVGIGKGLIYGAGYHGQRLTRWIEQSPKLGIKIVGYIDEDPDRLVKKPESQYFVKKPKELKELVRTKKISVLFIAHRKLAEEKIVEIFQECDAIGIKCWVIPSLYQFYVEKAQVRDIGGIPLVSFSNSIRQRYYILAKRFFDIVAGTFFIFLALPLFIVIPIISKMNNPKQPILFKQKRVGQAGKLFPMYKFRTLNSKMAKEGISPELQQSSKMSVDGWSAMLRRTGLDELPQLFNVLIGHMSMVGPRPEMPFIVKKYGPLEKERLKVKPGITGLWQISKDRKRILIHENMDYDLYYVENMSFNLDLAILLNTIFALFVRAFNTSSLEKAQIKKK